MNILKFRVINKIAETKESFSLRQLIKDVLHKNVDFQNL